MEAIERIDKFLRVMAQLNTVIKRENELLAAHKTRSLATVVEEKKALSGAYEQHIKVLQEPGALDGIDPALRRRLADGLELFAKLLDENRARVQATLEASHRMFEIIAEVAKDQNVAATGYGHSGAPDRGAAKAYRPALSVGVNQEL
jgi:tRNA nucleotidyltransferase/poly(A) polymerase